MQHNELDSKYRKYFAIMLSYLSIISIIAGINLPNFMLVSIVTIFTATTTYKKKFYPYSVILAAVLLFFVYSLSGIFLPQGIREYIVIILFYAGINIFIIFSALWHDKELGAVYSFALSIVLGFVMGIVGRPPEALLGVFYYTIGFIIVLIGIAIFILCKQWFKKKSTGNYFTLIARAVLSLIIYLIIITITSTILMLSEGVELLAFSIVLGIILILSLK